jgi:hypothetical protein
MERGHGVRRSKFTQYQIAFALKQSELGSGLGLSRLRREEGNSKLKRLVADLGLEKTILQIPFVLLDLDLFGSFPAFLWKRQFQHTIFILRLRLVFIHVTAQTKTSVGRFPMAFAANDPFPFLLLFFLPGLSANGNPSAIPLIQDCPARGALPAWIAGKYSHSQL